MEKRIIKIILSMFIIILGIVLFVFITNPQSIRTSININGIDITSSDVNIHETKYNTTSSCHSINNQATITCNCDIVITDQHYSFNNTINAVSCDSSSDLCGELCNKFVDDLQK